MGLAHEMREHTTSAFFSAPAHACLDAGRGDATEETLLFEEEFRQREATWSPLPSRDSRGRDAAWSFPPPPSAGRFRTRISRAGGGDAFMIESSVAECSFQLSILKSRAIQSYAGTFL
eukprot:3414946-Rhodomonas_salina.3